jgi:hypothetical protein
MFDSNDLIPGRGDYPETERVLAAGAEGAGAALPLAGFGVAGKTIQAARYGNPVSNALVRSAPEVASTVGTGAAGGAAGELAREALPGNNVAPVVAGVTAGGLVQVGKSLLTKGPVAQIARELGNSETLAQAGEYAQPRVAFWRTNILPDKVAGHQAVIDAAIPDSTALPIPNLTRAAEQMANAGEAGGSATSKALSELLTPELAGKIAKTIRKTESTTHLVNEVPTAIPNAPMSWGAGKNIRT